MNQRVAQLKHMLSSKLTVALISSPLNLTLATMNFQEEMLGGISLNYSPTYQMSALNYSSIGSGVLVNFSDLCLHTNLICGVYTAGCIHDAQCWMRGLINQMKSIYKELGVDSMTEYDNQGYSFYLLAERDEDGSVYDLLHVGIQESQSLKTTRVNVMFSIPDSFAMMLSRKDDLPLALTHPHVLIICQKCCVCKNIEFLNPRLHEKSIIRVLRFHSENDISPKLLNALPVRIYMDGELSGEILDKETSAKRTFSFTSYNQFSSFLLRSLSA